MYKPNLHYKWAMPNKYTFKIKVIAEFILSKLPEGTGLVPYCGEYRFENAVHIDSNPEVNPDILGLVEDVLLKPTLRKFDWCVFDPPFSDEQSIRSYNGRRARKTTIVKEKIIELLNPGATIISLGFNSTGFSKKRGFEKTDILLVGHGGQHNDTIITVERKINE